MAHNSKFTGSQADALLENVAEVMTISYVPSSSYLSYTSGITGKSRNYKIGDIVRVSNSEAESGYDFYKLMNIENGAAVWEIEGSGGAAGDLSEKVTISLASNQAQPDSSLNGLQIHVVYGDNDKVITWNGTPETFTVPMNMTYEVQYPALAGYAAPANVEYIALAGNERTITGNYNTTVMTIKLQTNQSSKTDLNTVDITLSGSISKKYDYAGSNIVVKVPTGKSLTVTPTQIEGYTTASAVTKTPTTATDSITFTYNTTILSVTLASNQGTDSTINGGTNVTVECGTINKTLSWTGSTLTQKIPTGQSYTITPAAKTGYKTPSAATGTASGTTLSESFTYQTELVKVTVNTDNSASVSGQTVTVNGETKTYASSVLQFKVPFGTAYTVSVNTKAGFESPATQSFTANAATRNVTMTYIEIKRGVYILDTDGNLVLRTAWNTANNSKAVGVAVMHDSTKFVIGKTQTSSGMQWGGHGTDISTLTNYSSSSSARGSDFDGEGNTDKIIAALGSGTYAAQACRAVTYPHGKQGYLPAAGQWKIAYDNKAEVDACMSAIGGEAISSGRHWSSSEYSSYTAWSMYWSDGGWDIQLQGLFGLC